MPLDFNPLWSINMTIERTVLAVAGLIVFVTTGLGHYYHVNFLFLTAFVGLNLLQSAFTGFCPLAMILKAFGMKSDSEQAA